MKVILTQDVSKVGKKFEVKDIADGYALNFLVPKGKAKPATAEALKKLEQMKKIADGERKVQEDLLSKNIHEVDGKEVRVSAKGNEQGHLFGAIHKIELAEAIKKEIGADILPDFIELEKPLKTAGEFEVLVKAHDKKATIKVIVEVSK